MDFSEATIMRLRAFEAGATFSQACSEREETLKTEMDNIVQVFRGVLGSEHPTYTLSNGAYLYLKCNTTTRAITKGRIEEAVTNLTYDQLRRVAKNLQADRADAVTFADVVHQAMGENLEDACITINRRPEVALRRPKDAGGTAKAPESIDRVAQRYLALKAKMSDLRKQKSRGKKRCADVAELTEPVIRGFMAQSTVQRVRLLPEAAAAASPPSSATPDSADGGGGNVVDPPELPLPELPVLLPQHETEEVEAAGPAAAAASAAPTLEVCVPDNVPERTVEFRRRTYTSRGKSPKLHEFTDRIPVALDRTPRALTERTIKGWLNGDGRRDFAVALCAELQRMVAATKGKTTEKLKIKVV